MGVFPVDMLTYATHRPSTSRIMIYTYFVLLLALILLKYTSVSYDFADSLHQLPVPSGCFVVYAKGIDLSLQLLLLVLALCMDQSTVILRIISPVANVQAAGEAVTMVAVGVKVNSARTYLVPLALLATAPGLAAWQAVCNLV